MPHGKQIYPPLEEQKRLMEDIEVFMKRFGLSRARYATKVLGDQSWWQRIEEGRHMTPRTLVRHRVLMQYYEFGHPPIGSR